MDKRAGLRQHFESKANKVLAEKQYKDRTKQLDNLENTMVGGFNALIRFLDGKTTKTEVVNQLKSISTPDIDKVVVALSKLDKDILSNKIDIKPLKQGLDSLKRELSLIPKTLPKIPEQKDTVSVKNLSEIKLDTSKVEQAIKDLKLDPKIDVKSPVVNVDAPNLQPLQKAMLDVIKAVKDQKYPEFPEIPKTDLSKVEKKLEEAKKLLKEIVDKPVGGGGGGGNGTPYIDSTGKPVNVELESDGSIPVSATITTTNYATKIDDTGAGVIYIGKAAIGSSGASAVWQIKRLDTDPLALDKTWADGNDSFDNIWDNRGSLSYS